MRIWNFYFYVKLFSLYSSYFYSFHLYSFFSSFFHIYLFYVWYFNGGRLSLQFLIFIYFLHFFSFFFISFSFFSFILSKFSSLATSHIYFNQFIFFISLHFISLFIILFFLSFFKKKNWPIKSVKYFTCMEVIFKHWRLSKITSQTWNQILIFQILNISCNFLNFEFYFTSLQQFMFGNFFILFAVVLSIFKFLSYSFFFFFLLTMFYQKNMATCLDRQ